jgi:lysophospholipase L1-like esterase
MMGSMSLFRAVLLTTLAVSAASCSKSDSGDTPTSPTSPNAVSYTVLGASDGIGVGGSIVCAPFDMGCENGTGYAQTIRRRFQGDGRTVSYLNLSWPGAVLSPTIANLAIALGRSDPSNFVERYTPFIPPGSTHVTLFTGGNDANIIGSAIDAGRAGADIRVYIDGQVRQWGNDLGDLVGRVRSRSASVRIVAYNLPNLGAAPYMAGRTVQERSIMQRIATGLTDQINGLTSRGVIVIDLMCDPRLAQPATYSSDGFHPSDAGYAIMADLGYAALTSGSAPAPQSACSQRTTLPVF